MAINSRFAVGVHILSLLEVNKDGRNTSDYIAASVNTNPVVVRRITSMLSKAGLVLTSPGVAGAKLARPVEHITLYDVYKAVRDDETDRLFAIHDKPNPDCSVGQHIQGALETNLRQVQAAMENELAGITLSQVIRSIVQPEQV
ncbi:Rrf2 family transcriptional regulator [Paenibacillus hodogayensis]|uniref:Rrf2 family transcriptional regulator n=1 Tax=Paenibacillus hodogayensis TaxID=279208 RepID=A0ABV5VSK2_9BACL